MATTASPNVDGLRGAIERAAALSDTVVLGAADRTFIDWSVTGVLAHANARRTAGLQVRLATAFVAKVFSLVGWSSC